MAGQGSKGSNTNNKKVGEGKGVGQIRPLLHGWRERETVGE